MPIYNYKNHHISYRYDGEKVTPDSSYRIFKWEERGRLCFYAFLYKFQPLADKSIKS
jgi:hypothetical protein